jgi:hypothetical protein
MWVLLASALAVSDTGSIALTSTSTEFATERLCLIAADEAFRQPADIVIAGRRITIRVSASCRPTHPQAYGVRQ